jgi:hypothetical protein
VLKFFLQFKQLIELLLSLSLKCIYLLIFVRNLHFQTFCLLKLKIKFFLQSFNLLLKIFLIFFSLVFIDLMLSLWLIDLVFIWIDFRVLLLLQSLHVETKFQIQTFVFPKFKLLFHFLNFFHKIYIEKEHITALSFLVLLLFKSGHILLQWYLGCLEIFFVNLHFYLNP